MPSKERPPLEASPLSEPSAWQLRFRRKAPANQQQEPDPRSRASSSSSLRSSPPPPVASIADQLLQSLAERERAGRPEHELSRACAEQLLGKRNAFVSDLRMDERAAAELAMQCQSDADVSALAKEIIRSRMQVENQAEVLRRGGKDRGRTGAGPPANRPALSAAERLRQLRDAHTRREREIKAEASRTSRPRPPSQVAVNDKVVTRGGGEPEDCRNEYNNERSPSTSHPETQRRVRPVPSQRIRPATTRSAPPQPDPIALMEERQAKIRERREARKLQPSGRAPATSRGTNQNDDGATRTEERLITDRIARLATENQQAVELAGRIRAQKRLWKTKRAVFSVWKRLLLARQDCAAHALGVFRWRTLQRTMARWRNFWVARRRERVANESRERRVRELSLLTRADAFHRKKQLPRWFYCWVASVVAAKERQKADDAAQRRRQQAQRLMERLVRGPEAEPTRSDSIEAEQSPILEQQPSRATTRPASSSRTASRVVSTASNQQYTAGSGVRARHGGLSSQSPPLNAPPPPPQALVVPASSAVPPPRPSAAVSVDPIYASMLERASERKERREVLRLKYERAQQESRETLAMQIEDRAAALLRIKEAERQRLREKKREVMAVARAKQERLEQAAELQHRALTFDRKRLLRYYAFAPWKFAFECRLRVVRYADSWHAVRVLHNCWLQWQALVAARRRERRQQELARLAFAAQHHEQSVRRRVWQAWRRHLQHIETVGATVERMSLLLAAARAWRHWQRRLADNRAEEYARQAMAEQQLAQKKLARALQGWQQAAVELATRRERQAEKQQLWSKVRGWLGEDEGES